MAKVNVLNPFLRLRQFYYRDNKVLHTKNLSNWRAIFFHLIFSRNQMVPIVGETPVQYEIKPFKERLWEAFNVFKGNFTFFDNRRLIEWAVGIERTDLNFGLLDWAMLLIPAMLNLLFNFAAKGLNKIMKYKSNNKAVARSSVDKSGPAAWQYLFGGLYFLVINIPIAIACIILNVPQVLLSAFLTAIVSPLVLISHLVFKTLNFYYRRQADALIAKDKDLLSGAKEIQEVEKANVAKKTDYESLVKEVEENDPTVEENNLTVEENDITLAKAATGNGSKLKIVNLLTNAQDQNEHDRTSKNTSSKSLILAVSKPKLALVFNTNGQIVNMGSSAKQKVFTNASLATLYGYGAVKGIDSREGIEPAVEAAVVAPSA